MLGVCLNVPITISLLVISLHPWFEVWGRLLHICEVKYFIACLPQMKNNTYCNFNVHIPFQPYYSLKPVFFHVACRGSIYRALGLMVAASPCALAVAPLAYVTAISACARKVFLLIYY